ncbi:MAG: hypothetical protein Ta2E_06700 [Mycoplasmoidaceae bacterium]|nr:MAG: hypothetical protein Ta2E_06700 [Mycoplasmoidaceae bacterium]
MQKQLFKAQSKKVTYKTVLWSTLVLLFISFCLTIVGIFDIKGAAYIWVIIGSVILISDLSSLGVLISGCINKKEKKSILIAGISTLVLILVVDILWLVFDVLSMCGTFNKKFYTSMHSLSFFNLCMYAITSGLLVCKNVKK